MGQAVQSQCPICKKVMDVKFRPFCSARCANIDLGGWLSERYTVSTNESPNDSTKLSDDSTVE